MEKWVAGIFILVLVLFLSFTIVNSEVNAISPSSLGEVSATCSLGQYATGENTLGKFACSNVPNNVQICTSSSCVLNKTTSAVIIPSSNANLFPTINLPLISTTPEVSYYIEENSTASIAASITPTAPNLLYVNGKAYASSGAFALGAGQQMLVWDDGTNYNGIVSQQSFGTCSKGQFVTAITTATLSCGFNNITFQNSTKTCSDTTATTVLMAGFKLNYTATGTGKVTVGINFELTTPATSAISTQYRIAFGTGNAPACNAAVTGTKVGNEFRTTTVAAVTGNQTLGITVGVLTLTAGTTYWFDVQMFDSTGATWIYSLPQMTVMES